MISFESEEGTGGVAGVAGVSFGTLEGPAVGSVRFVSVDGGADESGRTAGVSVDKTAKGGARAVMLGDMEEWGCEGVGKFREGVGELEPAQDLGYRC